MFGVMVVDTVFGEKNAIIFESLNEAVKKNIDVSLLYLNLGSHIFDKDFAVMSMSEITSFYGGTLIATCPITADILAKCSVNAGKVYYMWDLSFLLKTYNFNEMYNTLSKNSLIVRSVTHQKIIRNIFNLDSKVMSNFNMGEIWNSQVSTKLD
jgi:hypothetical protein